MIPCIYISHLPMLQLFSVAVTKLAEIGTYVLVFVFPAVLSSLSCETSLQTALKCTSFFSLKKKRESHPSYRVAYAQMMCLLNELS